MNDYLDLLVARATDSKSSIRPRLPSIFEPPTNAAPLSVMVEENESAVRAQRTDEARKETALIPGRAPIRENPLGGHEAGAGPSPLPQQPITTQQEEHVILPAPLKPAEPRPISQPVIGEVQPPQDANNSRNVALPQGVETDIIQPIAHKESKHTSPSVLAVETRLLETEPLTNEAASDFRKPEPAKNMSSRAEQAPWLPSSIPSFEEEMRASISKPAPRVTVHIGRIDIRVIRPTSPPSPRKSPGPQRKPTMTLDHYLRERNKGKT